MTGGAANIGDKCRDTVVFEEDGVGRRDVVGNQNGVVEQVAIHIQFNFMTTQIFKNTLAHLQHVLFAFTQILVFNHIKLLRKTL